MVRNIRLDHLSVGLSAVHCGERADWIRMPFGVLSGVGRGMGVSSKGKGQFWGEFGASNCHQWCLCCVVV